MALHEAHVDVSLRRLGRCRDTDLRSAPLYTPDTHTCSLTSLPAESQRESALLALQIIITALTEKNLSVCAPHDSNLHELVATVISTH